MDDIVELIHTNCGSNINCITWVFQVIFWATTADYRFHSIWCSWKAKEQDVRGDPSIQSSSCQPTVETGQYSQRAQYLWNPAWSLSVSCVIMRLESSLRSLAVWDYSQISKYIRTDELIRSPCWQLQERNKLNTIHHGLLRDQNCRLRKRGRLTSNG